MNVYRRRHRIPFGFRVAGCVLFGLAAVGWIFPTFFGIGFYWPMLSDAYPSEEVIAHIVGFGWIFILGSLVCMWLPMSRFTLLFMALMLNLCGALFVLPLFLPRSGSNTAIPALLLQLFWFGLLVAVFSWEAPEQRDGQRRK
jgi:hypothetical protein